MVAAKLQSKALAKQVRAFFTNLRFVLGKICIGFDLYRICIGFVRRFNAFSSWTYKYKYKSSTKLCFVRFVRRFVRRFNAFSVRTKQSKAKCITQLNCTGLNAYLRRVIIYLLLEFFFFLVCRPNAGLPHGVTGCSRPIGDLPSPPPCG